MSYWARRMRGVDFNINSRMVFEKYAKEYKVFALKLIKSRPSFLVSRDLFV